MKLGARPLQVNCDPGAVGCAFVAHTLNRPPGSDRPQSCAVCTVNHDEVDGSDDGGVDWLRFLGADIDADLAKCLYRKRIQVATGIRAE